MNSTHPFSHASTLSNFQLEPVCAVSWPSTLLSRSLQLLRLIKCINTTQFLRTWCMRQYVCQVLCPWQFLHSHTSRSNQVLKPIRSSNLCASCVQHLVCGRMRVSRCCPLWFQFHSVPNHKTSTFLASSMPRWFFPTLPLPLLRNCSMPLKPDPDCGHTISCFLPWSPHHSCFSVSLDHSPSQSCVDFQSFDQLFSSVIVVTHLEHNWHVFRAFDAPQKSF